MKKNTLTIMMALVNILSFWIGFKVWELGNVYLVGIVIVIWLIVISTLMRIKSL